MKNYIIFNAYLVFALCADATQNNDNPRAMVMALAQQGQSVKHYLKQKEEREHQEVLAPFKKNYSSFFSNFNTDLKNLNNKINPKTTKYLFKDE